MNFLVMKTSKLNIINESVDAMDIIRQKSHAGYKDDEPMYICNVSDVIQKHLVWKKLMPRVCPFYGMISSGFIVMSLNENEFNSNTFQPSNAMTIQL